MKMRWCTFLLLLPAVTLFSAQAVEDHDYRLTVDVELVQLPVSVLDQHGLSIPGLEQKHFSVYEDNVQQAISLFKQEDIPLTVGLVIDTSGSMLNKLDKLTVAANTFIEESNPADEFSIISFGEEAFIEQDFGEATADLRNAISSMSENRATALYDAVFLAADHIQRKGSYDKKVLIVVSDGEDNNSKYNLKRAVKAVSGSKIAVYTIGLLTSDTSKDTVGSEVGKKALKRLAEVTGGASFFPKNADDAEHICRRIARDLRNQYTIGYRSSNDKHDGSWRKVVVRVDPPRNTSKLTVRTRQGYFARTTSSEAARKSMLDVVR